MAGFPLPDPEDPRRPIPALPLHARGTLASQYVGRPATVSAAGGIGTAVGIIGIIASLALFCAAGGLISVSASAQQHIKQFAPQAMPISKPDQPTMLTVMSAPLEPGRQGLGESRRQTLIALLQRVVSLSAAQVQQLDALLREAGGEIFPRAAPMNDAAMADALSDHGTVASASASASETVFFVTKGGRVEIHDDGAVFRPAHGAPTVRTSAGPRLNASGNPILLQPDIDALISLIRQASAGKLNGPQTEALSRMLADRDQQLVALSGPADGQTIGISGAGAQGDGYLLVGFAGGSLLLSPAGKVVLKDDPLPGVSLVASIATMVIALVELAMAIWLVVLSRRLLKQTLLSPRPHRRWAIVKIALSIVAGAALGWTIDSFLASRPGGDGASYAGICAGIAFGVAGCVYPILEMLLLKKRSARLYFDGVM